MSINALSSSDSTFSAQALSPGLEVILSLSTDKRAQGWAHALSFLNDQMIENCGVPLRSMFPIVGRIEAGVLVNQHPGDHTPAEVEH